MEESADAVEHPNGLGEPATEPAEPEQPKLADQGRPDGSFSSAESSAAGELLGDFPLPLSLPDAFEQQYMEPLDSYEEINFDFDKVDVRNAIKKQISRALKRQVTPGRILLRDKLCFVVGTVGAMLNAYWLGASPKTFHNAYTAQVLVLFSTRWVLYRIKKWHYYLLDFCYLANLLLLAHLWIWPHSAMLHKVTFAFASGPLAWSIVAFRNSLVFHSLDKMTSLSLHWFPACVAWTQRWYPHRSERLGFDSKPTEAKLEWESGSVFSLVLVPMVPYLCWSTAYFIKIFVVSSKKIQRKGYETLYQYTTRNKKSLFAALVLRAPQRLQPLAYMLVHCGGVLGTFMLAVLFWHHFWAHTLFLVAVLAVSAWNGAGFYFQVFARRYVAQLEQRNAEVQAALKDE